MITFNADEADAKLLRRLMAASRPVTRQPVLIAVLGRTAADEQGWSVAVDDLTVGEFAGLADTIIQLLIAGEQKAGEAATAAQLGGVLEAFRAVGEPRQ